MKQSALPALLLILLATASTGGAVEIIRSARSGAWSEKSTWEGGHVPYAADRVQIRTGHEVIYDTDSDAAIHAIHIAGSLRFATDKDTRLCVGLIRIEAGEEWKEGGMLCHELPQAPDPKLPRPKLEIGSPEHPVKPGHKAIVRLVYFKSDDPGCLPAIICSAGQMDLHGAPMSRTWVKLAEPAASHGTRITLADSVAGWRPGDHLLITSTELQKPLIEEATIAAAEPETKHLSLDRPITIPVAAVVANLSRNVIIESATPDGLLGHIMYHRYSTGSIGYAEFRQLGKNGTSGHAAINYHQTGDTMCGSSVVGASIWDSESGWVSLRDTRSMVIRDCVGYRGARHGFHPENGSAVYNVFDHNLAIHPLIFEPRPDE